MYGGGISRQLANTGLTVSIFGTIYQEIDLDMTPQLAQHEALALVEQRAGAGPATDDPLTLVIGGALITVAWPIGATPPSGPASWTERPS